MNSLQVTGMLCAAAIVGLGIGALSSFSGRGGGGAPQELAPATFVQYDICGTSRRNCVVDGDTLWIGEVKVRIADIDAPEISSPRCSEELERGEQAKRRLLELVNDGPFEVRQIGDRDADKYDRKLRVLIRDGKSLGDQLVSEGLARTWTGRRQSWC
ncbi:MULTISPECIES: thermonuclease family protein [Sphingobium]|uniref:thermonuclease family protein n=1 Tax=Sphingobium TaxID=165695 RepID=UPI0015EB34F4|nr:MULTISPECIES: thermonuclease family protein [Sphingobium]MCW2363523.1 endonuclease YncB(thermonuclease family) [Sphingobium sp. B10D3B]MCW2403078.1 endonuclease YncB(thermonuclease family) [Sphingobium sp. B10D7B]MCW2410057.1 endonuclease YncB(thermonuclease family) [Sphingobium xanthum]